VLDGITYSLLYCYQHNGMDFNECNIKEFTLVTCLYLIILTDSNETQRTVKYEVIR
jgi:hypothetical protein